MSVIDSTMTGLTLPHEPDPGDSLMLFLNGQLLTQGGAHDYQLTGSAGVTGMRPPQARLQRTRQ